MIASYGFVQTYFEREFGCRPAGSEGEPWLTVNKAGGRSGDPMNPALLTLTLLLVSFVTPARTGGRTARPEAMLAVVS